MDSSPSKPVLSPTLWETVKCDFKSLLPEDVFKMWFEPMVCVETSVDAVTLGVPNDFAAIWIHENYLDLITQRLRLTAGRMVNVSLRKTGDSAPKSASKPTKEVPEDPLWTQLKRDLRRTYSLQEFNQWIAPLHLSKSGEKNVVLVAPSEIAAAMVKKKYLEAIQEGLRLLKQNVKVTIRGRAENEPAIHPKSTVSAEETSKRAAAGLLNPRNTFETFVVGSNCQMAHAAALAVAQAPAQAYNPLFLYGETGVGKTHLMHAIGHAVLRRNPDAMVAYLSAEKFTNEFIQALQENSLTKFRQRYRHVDLLLLDDIQFLAGRDRIQEEFFHTFNDLFESGKQIVLSSDRRASEIQKLESRLVSRFEWGLPADIQAPDLETRTAIIRARALSLNCKLPDTILNFIAQNITKNVRRLEGALIKVASYAVLTKKPIDLATAERLLHDVMMEQASMILTIETIQKRVADHFSIRHSDMTSKRRPNNIAIPRQIAMFLCRTLTKHSLQEIGDAFGGRDAGTVIHACKVVDNMCDQDASTRGSVEFLKAQLSK